MTRERLYLLLKRLSETDTAWGKASTTGATYVQTVSNAVVTFSDAALFSSASPPAEGQLWQIHEDATASLEWLRTCVRRLAAALRGANQVQHELATAVSANEQVGDALALPLSTWAELVQSVVQGLQADLQDKQGVLKKLLGVISGGVVDRDQLALYVVTWLEQPGREAGDGRFLLATFEAESIMLQELATREEQEKCKSPVVTPQRERKSESAAIAMLRQAGRTKKGRG